MEGGESREVEEESGCAAAPPSPPPPLHDPAAPALDSATASAPGCSATRISREPPSEAEGTASMAGVEGWR